ncbi:MAG: HAMP domain-containing sensor histidine kinase [Bacillota bacterium]|nr:HAMP domain-containing sensor histidine kinase [Bacillota bacterium]
MKSIRQRIILPAVLSSVLIPLLILVVFNVIIHSVMLQNARQNLRESAIVTQSLIKQQLKLNGASAGDLDRLPGRLANIQTLIRTADSVSRTDILVINQHRDIVFPVKLSDLGLNERALTRLEQQFLDKLIPGAIITLRTVSGQYLISGYPINEQTPGQSIWIIYMTRYSPVRGFLLTINLILLGVLFLGSMVSILVTLRTARRIKTALSQMSQMTSQVGHSPFQSTEPDPFCKETAELQLQFNQMAQRLDQADRQQKTFLQDASHALRTPLQIIQGYAEALENNILADVPGAAGIISKESKRLNRLVESLLTLHRIDNPAHQPDPVPLNITHWLQDQLQHWRSMTVPLENAIEIRLVAPDEEIVIPLDENLLDQATANIIANAIRYARTAIDVRLWREPQQICLSFGDDGEGIQPEDLPHLFDRFYKGRNGQFGLGLAIAKAAITALNGNIIVGNNPDGGALFTLQLPDKVSAG